MKRILLISACIATVFATKAQTTEYETGQSIGDPWTGWSTPVVTNCTGSVNGANAYIFNGTTAQSYTLETYRQFNINSNDIDIYFAVTSETSTVSIEYSTDNVSYTQITSQNWGAGYGQSTIVFPTYDPVVSTFYLKLKVTGTFGSPSQTAFNTFKIDAVLNSGGASVEEEELKSTQVNYSNGFVKITSELADYTVSISDLSGKLVGYGTNIDEFDLTQLNDGIYIVAVLDKTGRRETFKISHSK